MEMDNVDHRSHLGGYAWHMGPNLSFTCLHKARLVVNLDWLAHDTPIGSTVDSCDQLRHMVMLDVIGMLDFTPPLTNTLRLNLTDHAFLVACHHLNFVLDLQRVIFLVSHHDQFLYMVLLLVKQGIVLEECLIGDLLEVEAFVA